MENKRIEPNKPIMSTFIYKGQIEISQRPESFKQLKEKIRELYHITEKELQNYVISYKNKYEDNKYYILCEKDFEEPKLISEDVVFTIEETETIQIEEPENKNIINEKPNYKGNSSIKENTITEEAKGINFLVKPKIIPTKLKYINKDPIEIYVNLYEIILSKDLILFQYPFLLSPEPKEDEEKVVKQIFKNIFKELKIHFKNCFYSGKSLYSSEEVKDLLTFKSIIYLKNKREEFTIEFQKCHNKKIIKQEDIYKDSITKQYIELIIKDILHCNTKLDFYKDSFVMKNEKITINQNGVKVDFYPGFTTSFVETDRGNFLNVTLKHKIVQSKTILEFLQENNYKNRDKKEEIREKLTKCIFKDSYLGKNYRITDIDFDKNPVNTSCNYKGETISIIDYYLKKYDITINDKTQPLILVCNGPYQDAKNRLYFVPELCFLLGLEDEQIKNAQFMNDLANSIKIDPNERVEKINKFISLIEDTDKKPKQMSPKEKMEHYGIKIQLVK